VYVDVDSKEIGLSTTLDAALELYDASGATWRITAAPTRS
jgi:hypothetical protein